MNNDSKNSGDSFTTWLKDKHGTMSTPSELINDYVQKAVNSPVTDSTRVFIGQENEVYDAITKNGTKLIVRISHKPGNRLEAEKWALDAARAKGIPTPKVFLVEHATFSTKTVTFCIEEKLPGTPLDQLLKQGANVDKAISHIGELLGKIHSVKVKGYGYLQPDGSAWQMPFSRIMLDLNEKQDELKTAAVRWGVPLVKVEAGLTLLNEYKNLYEWSEPSLTHGDFCPAHILVENDSITGIIDMEECSGNHPVADFVWWEMIAGKDIPVEQLKASYTNKALFDENFDTLFHLTLLRHCFWMLMVRINQGNEHAIDDFKNSIDKALKFFDDGSA